MYPDLRRQLDRDGFFLCKQALSGEHLESLRMQLRLVKEKAYLRNYPQDVSQRMCGSTVLSEQRFEPIEALPSRLAT